MEMNPQVVNEEPEDVIKASAGAQTEVKDTPVLERRTTWAALVAAIPGVLLAAPDLARLLLPFIPESSRERVLGLSLAVALVAGIIFNRTATKNAYEGLGSELKDTKQVVQVLLNEKNERR